MCVQETAAAAAAAERTVSISMLKMHILPTLEYEAVYVSRSLGKRQAALYSFAFMDNRTIYISLLQVAIFRACIMYTHFVKDNEMAVKMIATHSYTHV